MVIKLSVEISIEDAHTIGATLRQAPPANYRQAKKWLEEIIAHGLENAREWEYGHNLYLKAQAEGRD